MTVNAPLSGTVVALADVPDPVFAGALVGPGVARKLGGCIGFARSAGDEGNRRRAGGGVAS